MSLFSKLCNKYGYYKPVPNSYYLVDLDDEPRMVSTQKAKNKFNEELVTEAVRLLLKGIGEDIDRPGLKETPKRVMKYWRELTEGSHYTNQEIADMFNKQFDVGYDPMVTEYIEDVYSHCEHHLALMFQGSVVLGYIPVQNDDGSFRVLGLSKLNRIVDMCSKRLQLQEKLATDIAECISLATGSDCVYVNITMKHGCVSARGAKSRSFTNVTYMTPQLRARKNKQTRKEFEQKAIELKIMHTDQ